MKNNVCNKLKFSECELAILRMAVDNADEKMARRSVNSPQIVEIIEIVEIFLKSKNLICYGGTAINNILPRSQQFYNKDIEIPDYDFFSANALVDAKELTDIYYKKGYIDVEAKSGQHHGTYKVYVNYIPVADITNINKELFDALKKESIRVSGILYAPPNFLRMSMYLELSRPAGDTSRWEKVLKRLILLNKNYPIDPLNCDKINFQRKMDDPVAEETIFNNIRQTFINQNVVFFGGYAISMYSQYMPKKLQKKLNKYPDFDVLAKDAAKVAEITQERLKDIGITNVTIKKHESFADLIPIHYELKVGKDSVAFIYEPIACHSYNVISVHGDKTRIATIDTMLSFYLAFIYANQPYYKQFKDRILCMANFLYAVQEHNRLNQKGLLKRFSIICYGHQDSVEEMRAHKSAKFVELKNNRNSKEYEEWFLNYKPHSVKPAENERISVSSPKNKKNTLKIKQMKKPKQTKPKSKKKTLNDLIFGTNKTRKKLY